MTTEVLLLKAVDYALSLFNYRENCSDKERVLQRSFQALRAGSVGLPER